MESSGDYYDQRARRQILDEDDDSDMGDYEEAKAEGHYERGAPNTNLTGTGLSSDSEDDDDLGGLENGAGAARQGGFHEGRDAEEGVGAVAGAESGDEEEGAAANKASGSMKELFGEDDDEDDDDDDDDVPDAPAGGSNGDVGRGGGGRYGNVREDEAEEGGVAAARAGDSSDDEDVFGEGGGIRSSSGRASSAVISRTSLAEDRGPAALSRGSDDEDELEENRAHEREREEEEQRRPALPDRKLQIPVIPRPPRSADVVISRLPNILGIKTEAFDPATFVEEAEADEFKFTTSIIRWRHKRDSRGRLELGEDGRPLLETNSRLVKWSDGSMQLLVGDEAFDVGEQSIDRSALFVQQMTQEGSVLQCQGELTKRITFEPSNVLSKAHRMLTLAVRKRSIKSSRIVKYAETADPEKAKQERARAEEALQKHNRRNNRYTNDKWGSGGGRRPNMDISYLEEGAYDGTSVRDIKRASRTGRYDRMDGLSGDENDEDEESEEEDTGRGLAAFRAHRAASAAAAAEAAAADGTEPAALEAETSPRKKRPRSKKRSSLGSDDSSDEDEEEDDEEDEDDDDDDDGAGRGRKRKVADDEDEGSANKRQSLGDEDSEEVEDEEDGIGGPGGSKGRRSMMSKDDDDNDEDEDDSIERSGGVSRASGSKRMNRSIAEDSDSE